MTQLINFPTQHNSARRMATRSIERGPVTPRTTQAHHVIIDRHALERALAALEPPRDAVDISAMHLRWYPGHLELSRAWNGLRLVARVPLNRQRNNLPANGLAFDAREPFGALGAEARLTLGFGGAHARQVALKIEPAAGQITVEVGRDALLVPITFVSSNRDRTADRVCLRHASLFLKPAWANEIPRIGHPAVYAYLGSGTLIGRPDATAKGQAVEYLNQDDLACILAHLDDLHRRPPHSNSRTTIDTSALLCSFEATPRSLQTKLDEGETVSSYVAYLSLPHYPFDRLRATAAVPEHGLEISITCHRMAPDFERVACEAIADPAVEPQSLAESRLYTDRFPGHFRVRLSARTVGWVVDTRLSDDCPLLAFRRDGQVDVLLARASDPGSFVANAAPGVDQI